MKKNKNYEQLSNNVIELVGKKENIKFFTHCVTRLRFTLKDKGIVNEEGLKTLEGTLGFQWIGEQLQIIVGSDVEKVYSKICEITGLEPETEISLDTEKEESPKTIKDRVTKLFRPIVDCLIPLMGLFIATGLIKGFLSACTAFGLVAAESGTYTILYALSDSLLYFFPIFIGFNCGKVFKTNQYITAAIGAAMVYPTIISLAQAGNPITYMGIPVTMISYTSSILPVIIASFFAAKIEKVVSKYSPQVIKFMLVPTVTLFIIVPLSFIVIGPIMTAISDSIGAVITGVWNVAPGLGGFLIGGIWQVLVMTGLHGGTVPFVVGLFAKNGFDILGVCVTSSMIALAGAALAMMIRSRQNEKKEVAVSAMISALLGVTEPALYGVALPYGKSLLFACLGGGLGGMTGALLNVKVFGFGGNGILQLPFTISPDGMMNTYLWIISVMIAFVSTFILVYVFCNKNFRAGENK